MGKFINSKKSFVFKNPESEEIFSVPCGYLEKVPDWVSKSWLFQAAVKDASITYIGGQSEPKVEPAANSAETSTEAPEEVQVEQQKKGGRSDK